MKERQWKMWLRQARRHLYCTGRDRKIFEKRIRDAVRELEGEQPGITFEQCVEILGTPEEAAREYLKGFSEEYVSEQVRWHALLERLLLGGVIILLLVLLFYSWFTRLFPIVEIENSTSGASSNICAALSTGENGSDLSGAGRAGRE